MLCVYQRCFLRGVREKNSPALVILSSCTGDTFGDNICATSRTIKLRGGGRCFSDDHSANFDWLVLISQFSIGFAIRTGTHTKVQYRKPRKPVGSLATPYLQLPLSGIQSDQVCTLPAISGIFFIWYCRCYTPAIYFGINKN